jgi:carbon monoxide dehydrogenase subunit G
MLLTGKFTLNAPIQKSWESLLRPETLASCIPGCEEVRAIDEKNYVSTIKQKVGPISVRFKFTTALTEIDPPVHLKAVGKGADLFKAGSLTHEAVVDLKAISAEEVEVSYQTNVRIVGRLAILGDRIIRAKAKSLEKEFTEALRKKLSETGDSDEDASAENKGGLERDETAV